LEKVLRGKNVPDTFNLPWGGALEENQKEGEEEDLISKLRSVGFSRTSC